MCLCILRPANAEIPKKNMKSGMSSNRDGAGFSYAHNGRLITRKGFFLWDEFIAAYNEIPKDAVVSIHFRASSGGTVNTANCHPFLLAPWISVTHNGIINGWGDEAQSDTALFCREILAPIFQSFNPKNFSLAAKGRALHYLIASSMEQWNKMVFLAANGEYLITREKNGEWIDGCWYSNDHFKRGKTVRGYLGAQQGAFSDLGDNAPDDDVPAISAEDMAAIQEELQQEQREIEKRLLAGVPVSEK